MNVEHLLVGLLCMAAGLFSAICGGKGFGWFMKHRKAAFMIAILGVKGARIFYVVLGIVLFGAGLMLAIAGASGR